MLAGARVQAELGENTINSVNLMEAQQWRSQAIEKIVAHTGPKPPSSILSPGREFKMTCGEKGGIPTTSPPPNLNTETGCWGGGVGVWGPQGGGGWARSCPGGRRWQEGTPGMGKGTPPPVAAKETPGPPQDSRSHPRPCTRPCMSSKSARIAATPSSVCDGSTWRSLPNPIAAAPPAHAGDTLGPPATVSQGKEDGIAMLDPDEEGSAPGPSRGGRPGRGGRRGE